MRAAAASTPDGKGFNRVAFAAARVVADPSPTSIPGSRWRSTGRRRCASANTSGSRLRGRRGKRGARTTGGDADLPRRHRVASRSDRRHQDPAPFEGQGDRAVPAPAGRGADAHRPEADQAVVRERRPPRAAGGRDFFGRRTETSSSPPASSAASPSAARGRRRAGRAGPMAPALPRASPRSGRDPTASPGSASRHRSRRSRAGPRPAG